MMNSILTNLCRPSALLVSILVAVLVLPACTTVNRGVYDYFYVDTVPQGAQVELSKEKRGEPVMCNETPCAIKLRRRSEFVATITLDGYEPVEIFVTYRGKRAALAGSVASNTVVGGGAMIGLGVGTAVAFGQAFSFGAGSGFAGVGASAAAGPAAGVAIGMILFDVGSGAGLNLVPNPIVIGLAPVGTGEGPVDPRVELYYKRERLRDVRRKACAKDRPPIRSQKCLRAEEDLDAVRDELRKTTREIFTPRKGNADAEEQSAPATR